MKNISFLSKMFQFFEGKFSIYLNRCVFVMVWHSLFMLPLDVIGWLCALVEALSG